MKDKKIVVFNDKVSPLFVKTIVVKYKFPKTKEFLKLFNSVNWERTSKRINKSRKHTIFSVSLYIENQIVGMGRVVGDGVFFTICDVVVDKEHQGIGLGSIVMNEIVEWYKTIEDDDTFLYLNASKGSECFYERFGFRSRPNEEVSVGMKWYRM